MARNSEKAMTTLARWRAAHIENIGKDTERRPYLATECDDVQKAEKWRRQILGEVSRKVAQVQNAGLGEFKLRDINDEINKLLREKGHWEDRILELGGTDYKRYGPKMLDHEGKEVPGNKGYKYFGATKDLPGVRDLFQHEPPRKQRKTRAELMKDIDADYYGYRDEDDGVLMPLEIVEEKTALAKKVREWSAHKEAVLCGEETSTTATEEENIYKVHEESDDEMETSEEQLPNEGIPQFIAHVPVPSQKEVEAALLMRKKRELLERYASDALQAEETDVKDLLGVND